MSTISPERLCGEIIGSTVTLARLADEADLAMPVPTCPAWSLRQLITHVGRGHRWAAAIVATRSAEFIPFRQAPGGKLPEDRRQHSQWLRGGASGLVSAIRLADDARVWTHLGLGPASYWARRMAHETAVHRADAQIALGHRPEIEPLIAADGIDEWLGFLASPAPGEDRPPLADLTGRVLHVHATDEGLDGAGEWLIQPTPDGVSVRAGHGRGDVAIRGPASALLLLLVRRLPPTDPSVQVMGDPALLAALLAATPF